MDKLFIGIDHHKKYCQVCVMNSQGQIIWENSIPNSQEAFASFKTQFPNVEFSSVIETSRNWGMLYDVLNDLELHPVLAHSTKVRWIAESRIKTDKIDARVLASLLRVDLIPAIHVPPREVRRQKTLLRQRLWLVSEQTRIKNRIHDIIDRNHLATPDRSDLFGTTGRTWMSHLALPDVDQKLLTSQLAMLDHIKAQIKQTTQWIQEIIKAYPFAKILETLPGMGPLLTPVVALEVYTIDRFPSVTRFVSFCGLAISTYSSGGKTYHGHLIPQANRYLRYAFVEAAWSAVRHSPYFSAYFKRLSFRLGRPKAIVAVARKLAQIAYQCLKEQRPYEERLYKQFRPVAIT